MILSQVCEIGSEVLSPVATTSFTTTDLVYIVYPTRRFGQRWSSSLLSQEEAKEGSKDEEMARYFKKAAPKAALVLSQQPHEEDAYSSSHWVPQVVEVLNFGPDPDGQ